MIHFLEQYCLYVILPVVCLNVVDTTACVLSLEFGEKSMFLSRFPGFVISSNSYSISIYIGQGKCGIPIVTSRTAFYN